MKFNTFNKCSSVPKGEQFRSENFNEQFGSITSPLRKDLGLVIKAAAWLDMHYRGQYWGSKRPTFSLFGWIVLLMKKTREPLSLSAFLTYFSLRRLWVSWGALSSWVNYKLHKKVKKKKFPYMMIIQLISKVHRQVMHLWGNHNKVKMIVWEQ